MCPFSVRISDPKCKFSSSHFLTDHNKCSRIHGHNYLLSVEITGNLNDHFFVVDFFILKQLLITIADELDHALLLPSDNPKFQIQKEGTQIKVNVNGKHYEFPEQDIRILPIKATTAELLAEFIYHRIKKEYKNYTIRVEISESEGATASFWEQ